MSYGIIYLARSPSGKGYVGQTTRTLKGRITLHISGAKRYAGVGPACRLLYLAIRKYGANNIKWQKVAVANSQKELDALECEMIRVHNTLVPNGYNLTKGGAGAGKWSDELKAHQSEVQSRPEVRAKRSASIKAAYTRPEVKARRKAMYANPEFKAKHSAAIKAAYSRPEVKAKIAAMNARPEVKARRKAVMNRPEVKAKCAATNARPEIKARRIASLKATNARPEVKARRRKSQKEAKNRPEVKAKTSASMKDVWTRPEAKAKVRATVKATNARRLAYQRGEISRDEYISGLSREGRRYFLRREAEKTANSGGELFPRE